nr:MAG TPA: hypothetical protein [Caudoviricetes sp.]
MSLRNPTTTRFRGSRDKPENSGTKPGTDYLTTR